MVEYIQSKKVESPQYLYSEKKKNFYSVKKVVSLQSQQCKKKVKSLKCNEGRLSTL